MRKNLNKGISTPIGILIIVLVAAIAGGGILAWQYGWIGKNQIPISTPVATSSPQPTPTPDETANWKIYRNEDYGFEFKYPPVPSGCELCEIHENEEEFDEVFSVNRTSLFIKDSEGLTLLEYVYKEFPKEWEEGPKYETTDNGEYLKETWVESRENTTVGDEKAIKVNYRFGGMARLGIDTFVEKNDKVFIFDFTAGAFCCDKADTIYELDVYDAMLSTFKFLD
jgi:hypothetical protein